MGAGEIGDVFASGSADGGVGSAAYWLHKGSHAALGCATASAKGGDCASGAFGGAAGEVFAEQLGKTGMSDKWLLASSRIATVFSAGAAGKDINDADATASNAVQNNYLAHRADLNLEKAKNDCASTGNKAACDAIKILETMEEDHVLTEEDRENLKEYSDYNDKEFDQAYEVCKNKGTCSDFEYLHVVQREKWNEKSYLNWKNNPNDWKEMPFYKNIFHNPISNSKYVDKKTGQQEIIVNKKSKELETNPLFLGTYNYYPPSNSQKHFDYDVAPYTFYGNNQNDIYNPSRFFRKNYYKTKRNVYKIKNKIKELGDLLLKNIND